MGMPWGFADGVPKDMVRDFSEPTLIDNMKRAYIYICMYVYAPVYKISI